MIDKANMSESADVSLAPEASAGMVQTNGELILATITGFSAAGKPRLKFQNSVQVSTAAMTSDNMDREAMSTVALDPSHVGRQVATMFMNQDPSQPVVIGLIQSQLDALLDAFENTGSDERDITESAADSVEASQVDGLPAVDNVEVDGKKVTIEGRDSVVLKCGESSITLTKAGKIMIRGKYILNRSAGVNRIMGGSVQVN